MKKTTRGRLYDVIKGECRADIYLSDYIGPPIEYTRLIHMIRYAPPHHTLYFYFNTPGGNADTALQLITANYCTQANTFAMIDGECSSAGSMIALSCKNFSIGPFAKMLCHAWRGAVFGKANEIAALTEFQLRHLNGAIRDIYNGFLTEAEITQMLDGKDFHFDDKQLTERLGGLMRLRLEALKKAEQSEEAEEVESEIAIEEPAPKRRKRNAATEELS